MKVLSIDYGLKRIGLAIGDTELKIAVPKGTIKSDVRAPEKIAEIVRKGKIKTVVLGLPLTPSGKEGQRAKLVREFASRLKEAIPEVEIVLWDERYTTLEARSRLGNSSTVKRKKGVLDAISAQIILEEYLLSL